MLRISPSKVPIYHRCGQAARAEIPIVDTSEAMAMGTACHAALAHYIQDGAIDPVWRIAEQYGVDEDELGWLMAYGRGAWGDLEKRFPAPVVERRLETELSEEEFLLAGTADVFSMTSRGAYVLDWKTSREKRDVWPQLAAYALLATEALGVEECAVSVCWLRLMEIDTRIFTRRDLADFRSELLRSLRSQTYSTGAQCDYCPRRYECPALARKLQSSVGQLISPEEELDAVIGAGRLPELIEAVKAMEGACKAVRDGVRRKIEAAGPIASGGRVFSLKAYETRKVDLTKGWSVLYRTFGEDIKRALSLDKRAAEKIAGDRADGPKYKAVRRLWDALDEAGAVERREHKRMEVTTDDDQ